MNTNQPTKKAFIVDDEEAICFLLSALLKKEGYDTNFYTMLTGAVSKIEAFQPDIIFLDLSLNDGSGFSIVPAIKERVPNATIIISSAHSGANERAQAKDLGINHFISKPLSKNVINSVLEQIH